MLESRKQSGEPAAPSRWAVRPPGGVSVSPELVWFRKDPSGPRGVWGPSPAALSSPPQEDGALTQAAGPALSLVVPEGCRVWWGRWGQVGVSASPLGRDRGEGG